MSAAAGLVIRVQRRAHVNVSPQVVAHKLCAAPQLYSSLLCWDCWDLSILSTLQLPWDVAIAKTVTPPNGIVSSPFTYTVLL
jgi:hypothetical protein